MRLLFKKEHRDKYPRPEKDGMTDEETFFIKLLDATRDRMYTRHSRFQLHYGLRRDNNFGERMASRVLQWRLRIQDFNQLLVRFPQIARDVLPVEKQDASKFHSLSKPSTEQSLSPNQEQIVCS